MKRLSVLLVCCILVTAFVSMASAQNSFECPGAPAPRLIVGEALRVLPGDPNNLRESPSRNGAFLTEIPAGDVADVVGGPECADGMVWWNVIYGWYRGWTVEGAGTEYWVEPAVRPTPTPTLVPTTPPTPRPTVVPPTATPLPVQDFAPPVDAVNRIEVGGRVRVISEGSPSRFLLNIRQTPGVDGALVEQVAAGGSFTVIDGPMEADGYRWWQLDNGSGLSGWAIEGERSTGTSGYARTLLPACEEEGERHFSILSDYLVSSTASDTRPCVFDHIQPSVQLLTSPDGTAVLFAQGRDLTTVSRDGIERTNVAHLPVPDEFTGLRSVVWSPDSQRIAFSTNGDIATVSANGSLFAYLTESNPADHPWVDWLADSETLLYAEVSRSKPSDQLTVQTSIYGVNIAHGGLTRLYDGPVGWQFDNASLSPDRSQLTLTGLPLEPPNNPDGQRIGSQVQVQESQTIVIDTETGLIIPESGN